MFYTLIEPINTVMLSRDYFFFLTLGAKPSKSGVLANFHGDFQLFTYFSTLKTTKFYDVKLLYFEIKVFR